MGGQRPVWQLNESLLQDPEVLADVIKELGHYFNTNVTPDSDARVVWEAHKAVIRGVFIKHGTRLKRVRTAQLNSLLTKLQTLETSHKTAPTRLLGIELDTVRSQITDILQFKAKAALQICCGKTYESGNKCGRLASYIPHIVTTTGQKLSLPQQTREFRSLYSSLYNLDKTSPAQDTVTDYISTSLMPSLPTETR